MLQVILDQWIDARERLDISVANCRESDFASSGWGGVGLHSMSQIRRSIEYSGMQNPFRLSLIIQVPISMDL